MALTITWEKLKERDPEDVVYRATCAFDSSYPTGGETLDASAKLGKIKWAHVESCNKEGIVIDIDKTNYGSGTCKLVAFHGDYAQTGDAILTEVDDTTDLSGITGITVILHGHGVPVPL